jgi:hypothetical protein
MQGYIHNICSPTFWRESIREHFVWSDQSAWLHIQGTYSTLPRRIGCRSWHLWLCTMQPLSAKGEDETSRLTYMIHRPPSRFQVHICPSCCTAYNSNKPFMYMCFMYCTWSNWVQILINAKLQASQETELNGRRPPRRKRFTFDYGAI